MIAGIDLQTVLVLASIMLVSATLLAYGKLWKRWMSLKREEEDILSEAHDKARTITESAVVRAQQTISEADVFGISMQERMKEAMNVVGKEMITEGSAVVESMKKEWVKVMRAEADKLALLTEQAYQQEVNQLREDLSGFRKSEMEKITKRADEMVVAMAKDLLGKKLTAEDHAELIIKSVRDADDKGVL